jgi:hypothetical protein
MTTADAVEPAGKREQAVDGEDLAAPALAAIEQTYEEAMAALAAIAEGAGATSHGAADDAEEAVAPIGDRPPVTSGETTAA